MDAHTSQRSAPQYRGRFAPTPSGPLHLGSLLTAVASYLRARHLGGRWLLRLDDLDAPRLMPGADSLILRQLEQHGLEWDETPRRQSAHCEEYEEALGRLRTQERVYGCACTRALLAATARPGADEPVYPGTCRALGLEGPVLRLRTGSGLLRYEDGWQGPQERRLEVDIGDFILRRRDGQIAYQLACAVDEQAQGVTEVVRGIDLMVSTFRQLWLLQLLNLPAPAYRHLPVLLDTQGRKLSKQNHAPALEPDQAPAQLLRCLVLLGQAAPPALARAPCREILDWALARWRDTAVPRGPELRE